MKNNIKKAILIKRVTDDGLLELKEHLKIGIEYEVDIDTIETAGGFNMVKKKFWTREVVFTTDQQWMPTELLEIII